MKPKTIRNFKVLLGQIKSTINTVKFLVCVFSNSSMTVKFKEKIAQRH